MILITGCSGFIGYFLTKKLLEANNKVIGVDNLNSYYDVKLKKARLENLLNLKNSKNFTFHKIDIASKASLYKIFKENNIKIVINLAAQAGVRYSIDNPEAYIKSNIIGFFNVLESCRHFECNKLVYASSSSVYGNNLKIPFSEKANTDHPISLYAATKKANEVMAESYKNLYGIEAIGLRFFTVYGPLGRPDMAYFKFTKSIFNNDPISVFNNGNLKRDFTFIDDVTEALEKIIYSMINQSNTLKASHKIYNLGNNNPQTLKQFIRILENHCNKKANKIFLSNQPGDVNKTYADISKASNHFNFKPKTSLDEGLRIFVDWYKGFYLR